MRQIRPMQRFGRWQHRCQNLIKQPQPDRKVFGLHISCFQMFLHWVPAISPIAQDGTGPETGNLYLVRVPVSYVDAKYRPQNGIRPHAMIECCDYGLDFCAGNQGCMGGGHYR